MMHVFQATHDFANTGRHHLPLFKNDLILVLAEHPSGWWTGQNAEGKKGIVPSTFLRCFDAGSPSEDLVHELTLMTMAQKFAVDLTGLVPAPLNDEDASLHSISLDCDEKSLTDIEHKLEQMLLQREVARQTLKRCMWDLKRAIDGTCKDGTLCDAEDMQSLEVVAAPEKRVVSGCANAVDMRGMLRSLRDEVVDKRCSIPPKLLLHVGDLLGEQDACKRQISICRGVLHEQLQRCHEDVQRMEMELSALSKSVHEVDCVSREEKLHLAHRVRLRDAQIRMFLKFWYEQATRAKQRYLEQRVRDHHTDAQRRREEKCLRQRLAEGRKRYIKAEDELHHWVKKYNNIKHAFERRTSAQGRLTGLY